MLTKIYMSPTQGSQRPLPKRNEAPGVGADEAPATPTLSAADAEAVILRGLPPSSSRKVHVAAVQPLLPSAAQPLPRGGDGLHLAAQVLRLGHGECRRRAGHRYDDAQQHGPRGAPESPHAAGQLMACLAADIDVLRHLISVKC